VPTGKEPARGLRSGGIDHEVQASTSLLDHQREDHESAYHPRRYGIGVSLSPLASAVAREGGLGVLSSACLDRLLSKRNGREYTTYEAVCEEVSLAKAQGGVSGINIMVAIAGGYHDTVRAAIDARTDVIISGGGLPLTLPAIKAQGTPRLSPSFHQQERSN